MNIRYLEDIIMQCIGIAYVMAGTGMIMWMVRYAVRYIRYR